MIFTTHQEIDKCLCDIVAAKPFSSTDTLQSFMCPYINEGMLIMKSFDTSGHIESDILLSSFVRYKRTTHLSSLQTRTI